MLATTKLSLVQLQSKITLILQFKFLVFFSLLIVAVGQFLYLLALSKGIIQAICQLAVKAEKHTDMYRKQWLSDQARKEEAPNHLLLSIGSI